MNASPSLATSRSPFRRDAVGSDGQLFDRPDDLAQRELDRGEAADHDHPGDTQCRVDRIATLARKERELARDFPFAGADEPARLGHDFERGGVEIDVTREGVRQQGPKRPHPRAQQRGVDAADGSVIDQLRDQRVALRRAYVLRAEGILGPDHFLERGNGLGLHADETLPPARDHTRPPREPEGDGEERNRERARQQQHAGAQPGTAHGDSSFGLWSQQIANNGGSPTVCPTACFLSRMLSS